MTAPAALADWTGRIGLETRQFPQSAAFAGQENDSYSLVASFEYRTDLSDALRFTVEPFIRLDEADSERTHADLRQFVLLWVREDFDLRVGVDRVFWGVTESRHLVDIVNQTDLVEDPDEEEKLGQPMLRLTVPRDWGTVDAFLLPYFRERTFPGRRGRLRPALVIEADRARYESGAAEWHPDMALRYANQVGALDFGVAYFHGTSRDPDLVPEVAGGTAVLVPAYPQIDQIGVDAQITTGPWLFKLEALGRAGQRNAAGERESFGAAVGGVEYTVSNAFDSGADVGLLGELLYDSRGRQATNPFEGDIFAGVRLVLNDAASSAILAGVIQDLDAASIQIVIEARTRLAENWTVSLKSRAFAAQDENDPLFNVRRDDFIRLMLDYKF